MMDVAIFIPLMVAAVQSAGQVLPIFVSKAKDVANKHIFDKEFLEKVISDSTGQLSNLLDAASSDIKKEIQEQSIIDVVQDLQAHITALGKLINLIQSSEITPILAERLITGGLLPLQVSLEKAEIRLAHYGQDDMRSHCHIIGTSALIAGYVFIGQDVPSLQKDLEDSIRKFQKRLLDSIAKMAVSTGKEIPWEKVPYFITIDGMTDLFELYDSLLKSTGKSIYSNLKPMPKIGNPSRKVEFQDNELAEWKSKFSKIGWYEKIGQNTQNALRYSSIESEITDKTLLFVTYADIKGSRITGVWFNRIHLLSPFTSLIATTNKVIVVDPKNRNVHFISYKDIDKLFINVQTESAVNYLLSSNTGDDLSINIEFINNKDKLVVDSFFDRVKNFKAAA
ncbi:MAG: hypothetical protein HY869_10035 [Chloroflexi bacterium]|nr:hypothetical protein [Chloroflexota bacterium]